MEDSSSSDSENDVFESALDEEQILALEREKKK